MPLRRNHDRAWRRRAPPGPPQRSERPRAGADRCGADARHARPPRRGYLRSREHSSPNEGDRVGHSCWPTPPRAPGRQTRREDSRRRMAKALAGAYRRTHPVAAAGGGPGRRSPRDLPAVELRAARPSRRTPPTSGLVLSPRSGRCEWRALTSGSPRPIQHSADRSVGAAATHRRYFGAVGSGPCLGS